MLSVQPNFIGFQKGIFYGFKVVASRYFTRSTPKHKQYSNTPIYTNTYSIIKYVYLQSDWELEKLYYLETKKTIIFSFEQNPIWNK